MLQSLCLWSDFSLIYIYFRVSHEGVMKLTGLNHNTLSLFLENRILLFTVFFFLGLSGFVQAMEFWKNYGILKTKFHIWKNFGI